MYIKEMLQKIDPITTALIHAERKLLHRTVQTDIRIIGYDSDKDHAIRIREVRKHYGIKEGV
jgi:hypothetical protein